MNQPSPLHIGAFLVVLLAFLFYQLSSVKASLKEEQLLYMQSKKLATQLSGLKDAYGTKEKTISSIQRLLMQSSLKSSALKMQQGKESLTLTSQAMDLSAINSLMGKLLNGSYKIAALNIERLSESQARLSVEIKW